MCVYDVTRVDRLGVYFARSDELREDDELSLSPFYAGGVVDADETKVIAISSGGLTKLRSTRD